MSTPRQAAPAGEGCGETRTHPDTGDRVWTCAKPHGHDGVHADGPVYWHPTPTPPRDDAGGDGSGEDAERALTRLMVEGRARYVAFVEVVSAVLAGKEQPPYLDVLRPYVEAARRDDRDFESLASLRQQLAAAERDRDALLSEANEVGDSVRDGDNHLAALEYLALRTMGQLGPAEGPALSWAISTLRAARGV